MTRDAAARRCRCRRVDGLGGGGRPRPGRPSSSSSGDVKLDWALRTGGTGSVIGYPANFSFDVSASDCSDVIYFTVNQTGGATTPNVIAITNAYAGCPGNPSTRHRP